VAKTTTTRGRQGHACRVYSGVWFRLSDEQKELQALAREFAEREIQPTAAALEQTHPERLVEHPIAKEIFLPRS
jgi:alkylation response protein AidB-like acyl-CoA dehydrogenase